MKNDSNSSLKIKQVIVIAPMLIALTTTLYLNTTIQNKTQIADTNTQTQNIVTVQENVQIATQEYEREKEITARSSEKRVIEEKSYKTIDEIVISKNMDLTQSSGISKEDFRELMKNLKADFFLQNSDMIYDLCQQYELNEIFFCGLIIAESGENIASNHRKTHNYISMMSKGKLIRYSSEEEGLEVAAKFLHTKYLTKGGSCYNGKTLASVQKRFCPNSSTWVNLVYQSMNKVIK